MQLATYAGWKLRGIPGGLIAGGLFVLPGAFVIGLLAWAYLSFGDLPLVQALFLGVKATVVVIVIQAILRLSAKALKGSGAVTLAVLAFLGLFLFDLPFPLIIALAALWGAVTAEGTATAARPVFDRTASLRILGVGAAIWAAPILLALLFGQDFLVDVGLFFSKLAVVTFGGAYAVLAYMTQEVVTNYGWIDTTQMIDALGLAETTPGPLILVAQFVGHLAGAAQGGAALAITAGMLTLWVTFVPCFIWIFAGAPLIDWLEGQPRISAALQAITAAVVGVIANLSLWFAAHVAFGEVGRIGAGPLTVIVPNLATLNVAAIALAFLAAALLLWRGLSLFLTLTVTALAGLALGAAGLT